MHESSYIYKLTRDMTRDMTSYIYGILAGESTLTRDMTKL